MRWQLALAAAVAAALVSMDPFQTPARAADIGLSSAADTQVYVKRPRRTTVVVYPRYRYARPRIIWQVDASSVQPAYVLR